MGKKRCTYKQARVEEREGVIQAREVPPLISVAVEEGNFNFAKKRANSRLASTLRDIEFFLNLNTPDTL